MLFQNSTTTVSSITIDTFGISHPSTNMFFIEAQHLILPVSSPTREKARYIGQRKFQIEVLCIIISIIEKNDRIL